MTFFPTALSCSLLSGGSVRVTRYLGMATLRWTIQKTILSDWRFQRGSRPDRATVSHPAAREQPLVRDRPHDEPAAETNRVQPVRYPTAMLPLRSASRQLLRPTGSQRQVDSVRPQVLL